MTAPLYEEVLGLLIKARGAPLSGEAMAREMMVTRAAVWKGIEALRSEGYEIKSVPARGYSLRKGLGKLRPGELAGINPGGTMGKPVRVFGEVDSTNREGARWADEGAPEGALVVARTQSAGRGRLGRSWHGEEGRTLMMSLVLRPETQAAELGKLTYVAALALSDALSAWIPDGDLEIKWPNDVLIRGRKTAGILLESRIEGGEVDYVVMGLGVNVLGGRNDLPGEFAGGAAVIGEEAGISDPSLPLEVLGAFLEKFEAAYAEFIRGGFTALKPRFDRRFKMIGKKVTVRTGRATVEGTVRGIGEDGSLILENGTKTSRISVGDVLTATTKGI